MKGLFLNICFVFTSVLCLAQIPDLAYKNEITINNGLAYFKGELFTGVMFEQYDNGKKKFESNFKNGVKEGVYKLWNKNGVLLCKTIYSGGKPANGKYVEVDNNGNVILQYTMKDGIIDIKSNVIGLIDVDGNIYNQVKIGTQVWFKENLKVTKYRNGDAIPTTTDTIPNNSTSKYQWGYGNENTITTYGRLYTWWAVTDSRNICPAGWHVPSDSEWTILTDYLGGETVAGDKIKETGLSHWLSPNTGADNSSGFTALPGGLRNYNTGKVGEGGLRFGYWWSATEYDAARAWYRYLHFNKANAKRVNGNKHYGFSVRCLRD